MVHRRQRRSRPGFTLLEVVLATTIGVLLLGALYVAVDLQLRYAQDCRDIVEESTLARALLARMDNDASQAVDLSDPARFRFLAGIDTPDAAASGPAATTPAAGAATTPTAGAATTPTTGAAATTPTTGTGANASSSGASTAGTGNSITLPLGVEGDSETLHLYVSRVPREILANRTDAPPLVSDLRRISYWLVGGGDSPAGLARQEVPVVTSDDATDNLPPGIENEASFIVADEVRSLSFQYFDGTDWQDSWDSTTLGADGVTPIGCPRAIAVTIGVLPHHTLAGPQAADSNNLKTYRHVIVIASANGTTQMTQNTTGATGTTGTTGTGSGSRP